MTDEASAGEVRTATELEMSSLFHSLLFAYEKVYMNRYGRDVRYLYPYLVEELTSALSAMGEELVVDPQASFDENMGLLEGFLSNELFVKGLRIEKQGDDSYRLVIAECVNARAGVHDVLEPKEAVCPYGLIVMGVMTMLLTDGRFVKAGRTEFTDMGTAVELKILEEVGPGS